MPTPDAVSDADAISSIGITRPGLRAVRTRAVRRSQLRDLPLEPRDALREAGERMSGSRCTASTVALVWQRGRQVVACGSAIREGHPGLGVLILREALGV